MNSDKITRIIDECDGTPKAVKEAANRIIMEEANTPITVGARVAVVDEDVSMGMVGKGTVKSFSADKQYADVQFDDGRVVPILTNSLYLAT